MRIAFLNAWWRARAEGSGTTCAINGLSGGLSALGHEVVMVTPTGGPARSPLARLMFNMGLPRRLAGEHFDLVVGFDWDGFRFSPPQGTPYVVALKGVLADEAAFERGIPRLSLGLQSLLEGINARHAHRVITPSQYSKDEAVRRYGLDPERVAVVPEGIDINAATPGSGDGRPTILSVARQYRRKNTKTLLAAMPRVRGQVPEVRLTVIGGGPELPHLKAQARRLGLEGCVELRGAEPDDGTVRAAYHDADLFCLPSRQEGFGIVFLEAMAAGLPVVAGNAAAAPEVVRDGHTGILVPPTDPEALADTLIALLSDPVTRRAMGAAGRKRALRHHWPDVAARFLEAAA